MRKSDQMRKNIYLNNYKPTLALLLHILPYIGYTTPFYPSQKRKMGACVSTPLVVECQSRSHWNSLFQKYRFSYKLLVVDFSTTWSGPCKRMEPVVQDCAAKYYDVQFIKIDADRLSDVAGELGVDVAPTFILLKRGKVLDRVVGADKDELERKIEKHRV